MEVVQVEEPVLTGPIVVHDGGQLQLLKRML
jgi:hypothetical protein